MFMRLVARLFCQNVIMYNMLSVHQRLDLKNPFFDVLYLLLLLLLLITHSLACLLTYLCTYLLTNLLTYLLIYLLTVIQLSLSGSSPYTSTDRTNKN
jgi:hypothetical protein